MYEEEVRKLQEIIDDSSDIVFFGGAGVSTESNIPDFRSADGLYQQEYRYSPEQIVSHSFFMQNPEGFYEFYKEKMMFLDARPNPAHQKLAELEAEYRRASSSGRQQERAGAAWKHSPQLLPEVRQALRRGVCEELGRDSKVRLRRPHQAGRGAL